MITIKNLKCPMCDSVMNCISFELDDTCKRSYEDIYKVRYKCNKCNTFLTTYVPIKEGSVIIDA